MLDFESVDRLDQGKLKDCKGTRIEPLHRRSLFASFGSGSESLSEVSLGFALEPLSRLKSPWLPSRLPRLAKGFAESS
jgi:hypothetical protein